MELYQWGFEVGGAFSFLTESFRNVPELKLICGFTTNNKSSTVFMQQVSQETSCVHVFIMLFQPIPPPLLAFPQMVNLLLAKGANINAFDKKDGRALHWAAFMGETNSPLSYRTKCHIYSCPRCVKSLILLFFKWKPKNVCF